MNPEEASSHGRDGREEHPGRIGPCESIQAAALRQELAVDHSDLGDRLLALLVQAIGAVTTPGVEKAQIVSACNTLVNKSHEAGMIAGFVMAASVGNVDGSGWDGDSNSDVFQDALRALRSGDQEGFSKQSRAGLQELKGVVWSLKAEKEIDSIVEGALQLFQGYISLDRHEQVQIFRGALGSLGPHLPSDHKLVVIARAMFAGAASD